MRFLAEISQNTVDSIYTRQNESFLLQCQTAQRNEYSKAKSIARLKAILTLAFAILSVVSSVLDVNWLSAVSGFLAVALVLFNKYSDEEINAIKKHAASIQQYIDAEIFSPLIDANNTDWGDIPSKTDLAESISKFGDNDTSSFVNWYSDYSSLSGEFQIFYCQRENVRWDSTLHRKFRNFLIILLCVITFAVLATFIVVNPSFVKAFLVFSWFLPVAEYFFSVIKGVNESISILHDADNYSKKLEKTLKTHSSKVIKKELIMLQYKIWNRRANGYLIPDWFYEFHRKIHQEKEDAIAKTIQSLDK